MPTYLQSTATECAAACLGYIAAHHGSVYEMSELRTKFAISMSGMTLGDLIQLSGTLGFRARPLRLELDEVPQLVLPCILHWDMNHFVVLIRCSRGKLILHDPSRGERHMTLKEAGRHFTGVALELTPAPQFERNEPRPPVQAIRSLSMTRITIAHRPETIAMADRVIDLSAGSAPA
ncbi:cysteine peptidase family C39 domain-containing protein [uncultured Variovorax sp.]|uniref:cysteine peptidase family C39 domain-containing protein n=1 Tax=uncultured Variovorax sp. TaxID=114708 RepID=UPI0025F723D8|nr:cysteine peptidase family C39 domain-containing protein [uncultured Variovorax sp.]